MARDPFDDFKKIEKMFRQMMEGEGMMSSSVINVQKVGDETRIEVRGDVPEEEIERLKKQHPEAEIEVEKRENEESSPIKVMDETRLDEESSSSVSPSGGEGTDEEELDPEELALKRFREKEEEEE